MRGLVNRYRDELRLSYANDGGHDQHCLVCTVVRVAQLASTQHKEIYTSAQSKYIRRSAIPRQLFVYVFTFCVSRFVSRLLPCTVVFHNKIPMAVPDEVSSSAIVVKQLIHAIKL